MWAEHGDYGGASYHDHHSGAVMLSRAAIQRRSECEIIEMEKTQLLKDAAMRESEADAVGAGTNAEREITAGIAVDEKKEYGN